MILELNFHVKIMGMYMYMCTNFQEHSYLDTEDTHTRVITKQLFFLVFLCIFHLSFNCAFHSPSKLPKMAYNLPSKMMLYFMKCTHFSYRYAHMPILYHHDFSYDLIHSLIPFDHPLSKCGHLNDTHCSPKIYVNGWYLKSYIQCQSFHMICL